MNCLIETSLLVELRAAYRQNLPSAGSDLERQLATCLVSTGDTFGALIRGQLVLRTLSARGFDPRVGIPLALAVEYFHAASLLLDDLPCMDNAFERRGKICAHKVYGESVAILASLALINKAYTLLFEHCSNFPQEISQISKLLESTLGAHGMLNGQALDLNFCKSSREPKVVSEIALLKTGALFRLSILLPAYLTGASCSEVNRLNKLSLTLGLIYQLQDDFKDCFSTEMATGKSARDRHLTRPNYCLVAGETIAQLRLKKLFRIARKQVQGLSKASNTWSYLIEVICLLEKTYVEIETQMTLPESRTGVAA